MKNFKSQFLLWLSIIFFVVTFSYLSIRRYKTLNSYYYDLGIMNQVAYNTSQGRFLEMTNQDLKKNVSRLAIHFDPILAAFSPFYKLYEGPEILLIGQALILGLGALAIYLISQKVLKKNLISLIFSLTYLLYFSIQRAVLFDFHSVTLATTFFLFALYFNLIKKSFWYFIFIFLCLLTKEHVGLVVFFLGIYLFIVKKEKRTGTATAVLGLVFFLATVYFIIPYFRGNEHFASGYFNDINKRLPDIMKGGVAYVTMLINPLFYVLLSPLTLLISLPEWAINILSINSNQRSIFFHYNSIITAFLFYSLILGFKNFNKIIKNKLIRGVVFLIFISVNIYSIYLYNPVPYFVRNPVRYSEVDKIKSKSIEYWVNKLKDENIKVSTTPKLAPFFTNRKYYYNFLYDSAYASMGQTKEDVIKNEIDKYNLAEYIIINRPEIGDLSKEGLPVKFYFNLLDDKNFQMIFTDEQGEGSIEVYKKI